MLNLTEHVFEYAPYPFGNFSNIFKENFYNMLCDEFPDPSELKITEEKKGEKIKKFKKLSLNNDDKEFKSILKKKHSFLKLFNFLDSEEFFKNISETLLSNHIDLKLNYKQKKNFIKKRNFNLFFEFSSIPCDGGYILPHTDAPKKIMTFIVPLIKKRDKDIEKFEKVGTSILSMSDPKKSFNFYNRTVKFEDTEERRYVNFSSNKMLMFIKTYNSLHSVGPIKPSNNLINYRNSITFAFRKKFD